MKRLNKIQINPARLMKDDGLISIKGGYDYAACYCKKNNEILCSEMVENCGVNYGSCHQWCSIYCTDFEEAICAGW
jgi:hypothetical protein